MTTLADFINIEELNSNDYYHVLVSDCSVYVYNEDLLDTDKNNQIDFLERHAGMDEDIEIEGLKYGQARVLVAIDPTAVKEIISGVISYGFDYTYYVKPEKFADIELPYEDATYVELNGAEVN